MKYKLGDFGSLIKNYEKARRSYPRGVLSFIKDSIPRKSLVLDLGCGTGIATRQIARFANVIGCDPDQTMLRVARRNKTNKNKEYVLGSSKKIPFPNNTFDAVTAFAAFHWFDDKKSIKEIRRVLKPGGVFFTVNRVGTRDWGEGYRGVIMKAIKQKVAHFKKGRAYTPEKSLKKGGFRKVRVMVWNKSEIYTLKNALEYVQSVSIWNSVPVSLRPVALEELRRYFRKVKQNKGRIERKLVAKVVIGVS